VIECGGGARLLEEAGAAVGIGQAAFRQQLDRDKKFSGLTPS
jgi:hypothetical protein